MKGGRICVFNWFYKSSICDDFLKIISGEINVRVNIYDIVEAYLNYKNKRLKKIEKEYESKFSDYRKIDKEEMEKHINKELGRLKIH